MYKGEYATGHDHAGRAAAYRRCAEDLRRQVGHMNKRQPEDNSEYQTGGSHIKPR